jgi:hypothetical protein
MKDKTYHIWVGYDAREHTPFQVCKHTLEKYATVPIKVHKLHHKDLRKQGYFNREWHVDREGQYIDTLDGKPFSTHFSHTRFLVPELWRNEPDIDKAPLAMFLDCDMIALSDIKNLFALIEEKRLKNNKSSPLYCVHHEYKPLEKKKMDGAAQTSYNRKLWSAVMVFDMENEDNAFLTPEMVNSETGNRLHNFCWVRDLDKLGTIPESWQFIPNHSEKNSPKIDILHLTLGGPWFPDYKDCRYSGLWYKEYESYLKAHVLGLSFNVQDMIHCD